VEPQRQSELRTLVLWISCRLIGQFLFWFCRAATLLIVGRQNAAITRDVLTLPWWSWWPVTEFYLGQLTVLQSRLSKTEHGLKSWTPDGSRRNGHSSANLSELTIFCVATPGSLSCFRPDEKPHLCAAINHSRTSIAAHFLPLTSTNACPTFNKNWHSRYEEHTCMLLVVLKSASLGGVCT